MILQKIKHLCKSGFVSLETYMSLCLEQYYNTNVQPLGASGDFITAPEISQLFGELLGLWFSEQYQRIGSPEKFYLVELGPGRGTLISDFLRSSSEKFKKAVLLNFVEVNPYLKELQRKVIYPQKAIWHNSFQECMLQMEKDPLPLLLIANEFFDALPIRQFRIKNSDCYETGVTFNKKTKEIELAYNKVAPPFSDVFSEKTDTIWEYSPKTLSILKDIAFYIKKNSGSALVIDYGENGYGNTLQSVKNHKKVDSFAFPGYADITAHVNFSFIIDSLSSLTNISIFGPLEQGTFLQNLGIEILAKKLSSKAQNKKELDYLFSGLYRLTAPSQMGSLFKVISILDKKNHHLISGFNDDRKNT